MINLWIEEQRHKNLKRKRKNWALLAILMFLVGMLIGKTCWAYPWEGCCTSSQTWPNEEDVQPPAPPPPAPAPAPVPDLPPALVARIVTPEQQAVAAEMRQVLAQMAAQNDPALNQLTDIRLIQLFNMRLDLNARLNQRGGS